MIYRFEVPEFWAASREVVERWFGLVLCLIQRIRSGGIVELFFHVHCSLDQHHTARLSEEPGVSTVNRQPPQLVGYADCGEFIVAGVKVFLPARGMTIHTPSGTLRLFTAHRS